jgi:DNA transformation protein
MQDDDLADLFAGLGHVTVRRMFGGRGIYHQGLIVGLVVGGEVLLKADEVSAPEFERAGASRWVYEGKTRPVAMPYWSIPDAALDDPEELATWTRRAFEAAVRSEAAKKRPAATGSVRRAKRGTRQA